MAYLMTALMHPACRGAAFDLSRKASEQLFLEGQVAHPQALAVLQAARAAAEKQSVPHLLVLCDTLRGQMQRDPAEVAKTVGDALIAILPTLAASPRREKLAYLAEALAQPESPAWAQGASQLRVASILHEVEGHISELRWPLAGALKVLDRRDLGYDARAKMLEAMLGPKKSRSGHPAHMQAVAAAALELRYASAISATLRSAEYEGDWRSLGVAWEEDETFAPVFARTQALSQLKLDLADLSAGRWAELKARLGANDGAEFTAPAWVSMATAQNLGTLTPQERVLLGGDHPSAVAALMDLPLLPSCDESVPRLSGEDAAEVEQAFRAAAVYAMAKAPTSARALLEAADATDDTTLSMPALGPLAAVVQNALSRITPTLAALNDNVTGRAFETALVAELVATMPQQTQQMWHELGQVMVDVARDFIDAAKPEIVSVVNAQLQANLVKRGIRPWDTDAPQMAALVRLAQAPKTVDVLTDILAILWQPCTSGVDVAVRANLIRDVWLALGRVRAAPDRADINDFYLNDISPRTARSEQLHITAAAVAAKEGNKITPGKLTAADARTGIMAPHQADLMPQDGRVPASRPAMTNFTRIEHGPVSAFLRQGHVTAAGVSGSTNVLLGMFNYAITREDEQFHIRDFMLGAAAFLLHDGGHSLHEMMWVVDHAHAGTYAQVHRDLPPQSYAQFMRTCAVYPEVQEAFARAKVALAQVHEKIATRSS